jgi:NADH-quinone oxidoreductase subunit M
MQDFLIMNNLGYPILSILVFLPLLGVIPLIILKNDEIAKYWTLAISTFIALVSLLLYFNFDKTTAQYQFGEHHAWIPMWDINYTLGIDGISLLLILLTTMIMPLCVLCSWNYIKTRVRPFFACLLIMETSMLGVFMSLDFVLFYILWEAMLIPMYLLIAIWGGPRKIYASIKFFLYTLAGSVLLLVAIIALYMKTGTFSIPMMMGQDYSSPMVSCVSVCRSHQRQASRSCHIFSGFPLPVLSMAVLLLWLSRI